MTDETLNMANELKRKIECYDNLFQSAKKDKNIYMTIFNESSSHNCKLADYIEPDQLHELYAQIKEILRTRLEELKTQYELL